MYYVLLAPGTDRQEVLQRMKADGINAVFHYVPLHSSPGGVRYGRAAGSLERTDDLSERLIRLPLWIGISADQQAMVIDSLLGAIAAAR